MPSSFNSAELIPLSAAWCPRRLYRGLATPFAGAGYSMRPLPEERGTSPRMAGCATAASRARTRSRRLGSNAAVRPCHPVLRPGDRHRMFGRTRRNETDRSRHKAPCRRWRPRKGGLPGKRSRRLRRTRPGGARRGCHRWGSSRKQRVVS